MVSYTSESHNNFHAYDNIKNNIQFGTVCFQLSNAIDTLKLE